MSESGCDMVADLQHTRYELQRLYCVSWRDYGRLPVEQTAEVRDTNIRTK
jgi:hypothetical protein